MREQTLSSHRKQSFVSLCHVHDIGGATCELWWHIVLCVFFSAFYAMFSTASMWQPGPFGLILFRLDFILCIIEFDWNRQHFFPGKCEQRDFHVPNLFGFNDHSWVFSTKRGFSAELTEFLFQRPTLGQLLGTWSSYASVTSEAPQMRLAKMGTVRERFKSIMFFLSWYSIWWCLTLYSCISLCRQTVHICIIMISYDDKIHLMHSCSYGIFVFFLVWLLWWALLAFGISCFFFLDFVDIYVEDQPIDSKAMRMNVPWSQWISWVIHLEIMDTVEKSDFAPQGWGVWAFHFESFYHEITFDWLSGKKHIKLLLRYSIMEIRKVIGDVAWMKKDQPLPRDSDVPFWHMCEPNNLNEHLYPEEVSWVMSYSNTVYMCRRLMTMWEVLPVWAKASKWAAPHGNYYNSII